MQKLLYRHNKNKIGDQCVLIKSTFRRLKSNRKQFRNINAFSVKKVNLIQKKAEKKIYQICVFGNTEPIVTREGH